MPWDLIVVGILILVISGIAGWNMRKTRNGFTSYSNPINTDELADKIGKAVARELKPLLENLKVSSGYDPRLPDDYTSAVDFGVKMDESIIPTNLKIDVEATNLETATREEKVIDKDLEKSKSRLANLRKKKEN